MSCDDSTRYSTHSNRSANAPMKTLDALRPQPLTSEHYCPHDDGVQGGAAILGGGGNAARAEKGTEPLHRECVCVCKGHGSQLALFPLAF